MLAPVCPGCHASLASALPPCAIRLKPRYRLHFRFFQGKQRNGETKDPLAPRTGFEPASCPFAEGCSPLSYRGMSVGVQLDVSTTLIYSVADLDRGYTNAVTGAPAHPVALSKERSQQSTPCTLTGLDLVRAAGVEPALRWQGVRMHHVPTHACSGHLPGYQTLRMSAAGLAHPAYRIQRGFSFLV